MRLKLSKKVFSTSNIRVKYSLYFGVAIILDCTGFKIIKSIVDLEKRARYSCTRKHMSKLLDKNPFIYHYYRAEVYRETIWRNRLDATTNWAIIVSAAIISFAFGDVSVPHTAILINVLCVGFFLYIESRRFRNYTLLKRRTRFVEERVLSPLFRDGSAQSRDMIELSNLLTKHTIKMSRLEAMAWRLRRNYLFIFWFLYLAWVIKIGSITNASVFTISGEIVFGLFSLAMIALVFVAQNLPKHSLYDDLP